MQATEKISELTEEKKKLEKEQGKLLATNVEMAMETKKLLLLQKEWKQEKSDLLAANSEFAEEVERLYKAEERWEEEKEEARREAEAASAGLQQELVELGREVERERGRWEEEVRMLQERLVLREEQEVDNQWQEERRELEQRLEEVKEQVKGERGKREEAEEMVSRLSQELENEEKELMEVKAAFVDLSKKYTDGEELAKLKDNVDHIKAENFEHIIENEELKTKLEASLEKSEKMKKELEKVKSEKKRLELSAKREKESEGERRREREEVESAKSDLRVEREKVRLVMVMVMVMVMVNSAKPDLRVEIDEVIDTDRSQKLFQVRELANRQMALVDENKELKEENDR